MTPPAVTGTLLHDLVTHSHAEGITALGVEAAIEHDDRILLIAEPGPDFTDDTWQLPAGPVLPGQTLTDALHPAVASIGLTIDGITGYLGHHDHPGVRQPPGCSASPSPSPIPAPSAAMPGPATAGRRTRTARPAIRRPCRTGDHARRRRAAAAGQLRAWAHGIYPDEAGVELFIGHASFLRRADFASRFISIPGDGLAVIDWPAAIAALDDSLPCSGAENRMLRLAASLADGIPVNLRDALTGIDDRGIRLVIKAALHASGQPDATGIS